MKGNSTSTGNSATRSLGRISLRLLVLMAVDAMASMFVVTLFADGYWQLGVMTVVVTLGLNVIFIREDAYPLRWMSPGLVFMLLLSIYPILFTIYVSFTNFGTGHLLPKVQAIEVLSQRQFLPEGGLTYDYTVFKSKEGGYALWLQREGEPGILVLPSGEAAAPSVETGPLDENGVPVFLPGYERLNKVQILQSVSDLQDITFGEPPHVVQLTAQLGIAAELEQRYVYDGAQDAILDRKTDVTYQADPEKGLFISTEGEELLPGYQVSVGLRNFSRFFTNPSFRGPLLRVFVWTFAFAFLSVLFAFSLGLLIALAFGRNMPFQKIIKAALIIPFAIPNVITILIWRGLLNPLNGVISTTLQNLLNQPVGWPPVFSDPWWVKAALILINVWLAYPYFMLTSSGALQAIPADIYEAAEIDGANVWQRFWHVTLPLLLIGVGPLLLASFTVNFNSFNVIFMFNQGGPPMAGTATPAGHSDILISYVYRLAFGGGGGQDFGYAAAITIIIFFILVAITMFQYRSMRVWEELGKNV